MAASPFVTLWGVLDAPAFRHAKLRPALLLHCYHIATALLWHSIPVAMQMLCSSNVRRRLSILWAERWRGQSSCSASLSRALAFSFFAMGCRPVAKALPMPCPAALLPPPHLRLSSALRTAAERGWRGLSESSRRGISVGWERVGGSLFPPFDEGPRERNILKKKDFFSPTRFFLYFCKFKCARHFCATYI